MKILFVYGNIYSWGGIQTWLIRIAPKLRARGHEVTLLTREMSGPNDVTSEIVDRLASDATLLFAGRHWFRAPRSLRPPLGEQDVLFACGLEALLLAALVQQHLTPAAKIVAGVFSPREYCWKTSRLSRRWSQHVAERLVRRLPLRNFVFSTNGMARQTGECLSRDLSESPVFPIPIDTERLRPAKGRSVNPHKIVSVSRLTPYYTHNSQMIRVIRELRDRGHNFTYHVYGEGVARPELEAEARRLLVDDAVFFHGTVAYDDFAEAIGDAFLYIGLATGLIEAAACGIPALVGIDSQPSPDTYGFLHETVGNDLGGYVPGHPKYRITERVLWLVGRTDEQYRQIEAASRARAEEFGLDRLLPRLIDILERADRPALPISKGDCILGQLDWILEAVLLNLGGHDAMGNRHVRSLPMGEPNPSTSAR